MNTMINIGANPDGPVRGLAAISLTADGTKVVPVVAHCAVPAKSVMNMARYVATKNGGGLISGDNITPSAPILTISSITLADPPVIESTAHGLATGDYVCISDCNTEHVNGVWQITVLNANTFSIDSDTIGDDAFSSDVEICAAIYAITYDVVAGGLDNVRCVLVRRIMIDAQYTAAEAVDLDTYFGESVSGLGLGVALVTLGYNATADGTNIVSLISANNIGDLYRAPGEVSINTISGATAHAAAVTMRCWEDYGIPLVDGMALIAYTTSDLSDLAVHTVSAQLESLNFDVEVSMLTV